jgi:hypothetical protein
MAFRDATGTSNADRSGSSRRPILGRVSRWIGRLLGHSHTTSRSEPSPLPSQRPRPITPSDARPCLPQSGSPFFFLPPEIRNEILLCAFGQRTLHMDLRPYYNPALHRHGVKREVVRKLPKVYAPPTNWKWQSSVCHHNAPWTPAQHPWWCKCSVGIMGWLLSCRQA